MYGGSVGASKQNSTNTSFLKLRARGVGSQDKQNLGVGVSGTDTGAD